jgi:hypothetical protein
MSNCSHQHKENFHWLPKTLIHDDLDHYCACVKCYLTDIVSIAKIEFVWIIEYILLLTVLNSESNRLEDYFLYRSSRPRSPPTYI